MASPVVIPCEADTIVPVVTGVTSVTLRVISNSPTGYSWSYRDAAAAAPANIDDFVPMKDGETLNFAVASDVYVYAAGNTGSVRVDT